jgi:hypothetical protein
MPESIRNEWCSYLPTVDDGAGVTFLACFRTVRTGAGLRVGGLKET